MKTFCFRTLMPMTLVVVSLHASYAQMNAKAWDRTIGGIENDLVSTIHLVPGSGFLVAGSSFSGISGEKTQPNRDATNATSDFWLVFTDLNGNIQWDQTYGGNNSDLHVATAIAVDGFVAAGHTFSPLSAEVTEENRDTTGSSNDFWMVKTDLNGQKLWDKRFGGTAYENFGALAQTLDGGYVLAGSTNSDAGADVSEPARGSWDFWLVRTDAAGQKIWDKRFGGAGEDYCVALLALSDGGFVAAGYSNSPAGGDKSEDPRGAYDYWLVRMDAQGNKIWDKTFGGLNNDWLFAASVASNDDLVLAGQSFSPASGEKSQDNHDSLASGSDRWIIRTDSSGTILWDRSIGGDRIEDVSQVIATADGGFIFSGESYSQNTGDKTEPNLGPEQTWIVKTDATGNVLWDKTLFTPGHDESGYLAEDGYGCLVAVNFCSADTGGYKTGHTRGYGDYFMIKMCPDNTFGTHDGSADAAWYVYPNPGNDVLYLGGTGEIVSLTVCDMRGKTLRHHPRGTRAVDVHALPAGPYCLKIETGSLPVYLRFIKTE